ncbi:hypothetical protein BpHYR1_034402 [Brachionus plicatilis]|uniref:Uncharacterized protein n=1 Tax=Brachionus plicatilis TaxID=10195 RepID=A0A3M7SVN0_BRAPC|nr:hypothetical protein BpHYR1_034402 [Brachionus plicatilis]
MKALYDLSQILSAVEIRLYKIQKFQEILFQEIRKTRKTRKTRCQKIRNSGIIYVNLPTCKTNKNDSFI